MLKDRLLMHYKTDFIRLISFWNVVLQSSPVAEEKCDNEYIKNVQVRFFWERSAIPNQKICYISFHTHYLLS